jgi:iron(III) transport system ATP-binding protein
VDKSEDFGGAAIRRPYLTLNGLSKRFGSVTVVDAVDLSVDESRFICVLGPSGCGKTTLLRMIAGFETPDGGSIIQNARDVTKLPPEARDFGIVFQSYALFPNRTVAENISFGLEATRQPAERRKAKTDELLALVGLNDHARKYPSQISGGQQQRVALARALALSPGLLLLDEPLSALDANVRAHLRMELRTLQRRVGVTTLMVTHDREEAFSLADEIVIMNEGRIQQVGAPNEIYEKPANLFVARLLGACNALPAAAAQALSFSVQASKPDSMICFRPGAVRVGNEAASHPKLQQGKVKSLTFLGETVRLVLSPERMPALDIEAEVLRARLTQMPQPGDAIGFAVSATDQFVLDSESSPI